MSARRRKFEVGDLVYILNFRPGVKWIPGEIIQSNGPVSFSIQLQNGKIVRRHQDHMLQRTERQQARSDSETVADDDSEMLTEMPSFETSAETSSEIADTERTSSSNRHVENSSNEAATSTSTSRTSATPRYPQRVRNQPDRFHPSF